MYLSRLCASSPLLTRAKVGRARLPDGSRPELQSSFYQKDKVNGPSFDAEGNRCLAG